MRLKIIILSVLLCCATLGSIGQTDYDFWFAAPAVTPNHNPGGGQPVFFYITSVKTSGWVRIYMPRDPSFDTTFYINAGQSIKFDNTFYSRMTYANIANEYVFPTWGISDKGIFIHTTSPVTVYFEYSNTNNPDIWALKGKNGLGEDFYTTFQTHWYNQNLNWPIPAYSAFDIVATENNTVVTIESDNPILGHETQTTFTVILQAGQVYSAVPARITTPYNGWKASDWCGRAGVDHLSGARITTNAGHPVVVNLKDDSMKYPTSNGSYGCYDLGGDQTIPTSIIGQEYIAIRGRARQPPAYPINLERLYIVGTQDGDQVFINDVFYSNLNRKQTVVYLMTTDTVFIRTNSPSYVLQVTGFGCEIGYAVLPAIDQCTGSSSVSFTRSSTNDLYLNLMVYNKNNAKDSFYLNGVKSPLIPGTAFKQVSTNTKWWAARLGPFTTAQIPTNVRTRVANTGNVFHLGIINGNQTGGTRYGYFSNYNPLEMTAKIGCIGDNPNNCFDGRYGRGCDNEMEDSVQLILNTNGTNITWSPNLYINNPTIDTPKVAPPYTILYTVDVSGACDLTSQTTVSIEVFKSVEANFIVDKTEGCAPLEITCTARLAQTKECRWNFGNGTANWIFADTVTKDSTFKRTYINTSDTAQRYMIQLVVYSKHDCIDTLRRWITVYPSIDAAFSVSENIGCNPLDVDVTDQSSGNLDTTLYLYTFGDNNSSRLTNPSHTYYNLGHDDTTYIIQLVVTSPFLCTDTAVKNITVHPQINANMTMDKAVTCANYHAILTNQSIGVDSFFLDFDDGTDTIMTNFSVLTHHYLNSDTFPYFDTISLIVRNFEGCYDTVLRPLQLYPDVIAGFIYNPPLGCDSTLVQFTNQSVGYKLKYYWNFGDSSTSQFTDPLHLYLNKDTVTHNYIAQLIIESKYLCKDTHSVVIPVYPFIDASFYVDTVTGCSPYTVHINNTSRGVDNYQWDYGDGQTTTTDSVQIAHTYQNPGFINDTVYLLSLRVSNTDGCRDSLFLPVTVYPTIISSFTADISGSCDPAVFRFISASSGAALYKWDFGDNSFSTQTDSATHQYERNNNSAPKIYSVSLLVTSANSRCVDISNRNVTVNPYTYAEFAVDDYIDCSPFTARFINSSFGATNTFRWFIDGVQDFSAPSDSSDYTHVFRNLYDTVPLIYIIRLDAENRESCTSSYTDTIAVYPEVIARFGVSPGYAGCHPFDVQFSDSSLHGTLYYWDFGDHTSSALTDPAHRFMHLNPSSDTTFSVELLVSSQHCADSITKQITVYGRPDAEFYIDTTVGCQPLLINITNTSRITSGTFNWFFDDGQTDLTTDLSPLSHTYNHTDSVIRQYNLYMVAQTNTGRCRDSASLILQVYPDVTAGFTYNPAGCHPHTVQFNNTTVNGYIYSWDFDNGMSSTVVSPSQRFDNIAGQDEVFNVKLLAASRYNCRDSITQPVVVYPTPVAMFYAKPVYQQYKDYPLDTITNETRHRTYWNYSWNFGDGTTSSVKDSIFTHEYRIWGPNSDSNELFLTLIVTNPTHPECRDTAYFEIVITPPEPKVEILDADSTGCQPLTLTFTIAYNYSNPDSTIWYFDDGSPDTKGKSTVTHTYTDVGVYYLKVRVVGDGGAAYAYKLIEVYRKPVVNFDVDPTELTLPDDATAQFFNKSQFGSYDYWDFGDGTTSTTEDPMHTYTDSANYTVKLVVTSENGCQDSLIKPEVIKVDNAGDIEFPNAFRPNADGPTGGKYSSNEITSAVFRPVSRGVSDKEYLFQVFNRWGEKLFETTDIYTGWDGYYAQRLCKQDVYVFKVQGMYINGTKFKKVGTITLLR